MLTFYDDVTIISDFEQVPNQKLYSPVPDDWWIVTGDIRNSTGAIQRGKYKEVNAAGASLIAAISNVYGKNYKLPFTFGGDGASILIPNSRIEEVKRAILFCCEAANQNFGLEYKAGIISLKDVRTAGFDLAVAKFKLSDITEQTLFWGFGLDYAESLIKKNEYVGFDQKIEPKGSMEGLECRWQEIPAKHDEIMSCIIIARGEAGDEKSKVYSECLKRIGEIYGPLNNCNPVSEERLKFSKNWKKLNVEWRIRTWKPTLKRRLQYAGKLIFQIITGQYLMSNDVTTKATTWGRYKSDLVKHSDFRKFDGGLRFVVSSTKLQRKKLEKFLEKKYAEGNLYYGLHSSSGLMITCFITNYHREHVHFVDGADGGYVFAAQKIKKQKETKSQKKGYQ
ncbi:MAG: DUF3095 family protein [Balneolaceae bacterium]|nr:DUF3095 family protein [Balneolaceae bacterium]